MHDETNIDDVLASHPIPRSVACPELSKEAIEHVTRLVFGSPAPTHATGLLWIFGNRSRDFDLIAKRFHDDRLPMVLLTGGIIVKNEGSWDIKSLAEIGREELIKRGVPEHVILIEESSANTLEEVQNGRKVLIKRGFMPTSILYASSAYHLGRCRLTLQLYFPISRLIGIPLRTVRDGIAIEAATWYEHNISRDRVWGEYIRIRVYAARGDIAKPTLF